MLSWPSFIYGVFLGATGATLLIYMLHGRIWPTGGRGTSRFWRAWWWVGYHGPYQLSWRRQARRASVPVVSPERKETRDA